MLQAALIQEQQNICQKLPDFTIQQLLPLPMEIDRLHVDKVSYHQRNKFLSLICHVDNPY